MGTVALSEEYYVSVGDVEVMRVDCTDHLGTESISTVSVTGSSDLTISSVSVSTEAWTIRGRSAAAGKAAQALVSGFVAATTFTLPWTFVTNGTLPRTFIRSTRVICK